MENHAFYVLVIEWLAKLTVVLLLGVMLLHVAKRSSAAAKVHIIKVSFFMSVLLPVVASFLPEVPIVVVSSVQDSSSYLDEITSSASQNVLSGNSFSARRSLTDLPLIYVLLVAWFAGVVFFMWLLLGQYWACRELMKSSTVIGDQDFEQHCHRVVQQLPNMAEIRLSHELVTPVAIGVFNSVILLPEDAKHWNDTCLRSALVHEQAHIENRDNLDRTLVYIVCTLFWFHPVAWYLLNKLKEEQEKCADNYVIGAGVRASSYAQNLLEIVKSINGKDGQNGVLAKMGSYSFFPQRMKAILAENQNRETLTMSKRLSISLLFLIFTLPLSKLTAASSAEYQTVQLGSATQTEQPVLSADARAIVNGVENDTLEVFERRLEEGFNISKNEEGIILNKSIEVGRPRFFEILLEAGLDINQADKMSIVLLALENQDKRLVQLVFDAGAQFSDEEYAQIKVKNISTEQQ